MYLSFCGVWLGWVVSFTMCGLWKHCICYLVENRRDMRVFRKVACCGRVREKDISFEFCDHTTILDNIFMRKKE